ncbi:MAG: hypothetical protein H7840_00490 [Alphaproteobacteria bacterium]
MITICEGRLCFEFPDEWRAIKYDDEDGFACRKITIPDTRKVDMIVLSPSAVMLFEVKDFRHYAIENKCRFDLDGNDSLHVEIAKKVRDTLSVLIAAHRQNVDVLFDACRRTHKGDKTEVILFLEEDEECIRKFSDRRSNIQDSINIMLKPFNIRCQVQRRRTLPSSSPWRVRSRAMAETV